MPKEQSKPKRVPFGGLKEASIKSAFQLPTFITLPGFSVKDSKPTSPTGFDPGARVKRVQPSRRNSVACALFGTRRRPTDSPISRAIRQERESLKRNSLPCISTLSVLRQHHSGSLDFPDTEENDTVSSSNINFNLDYNDVGSSSNRPSSTTALSRKIGRARTKIESVTRIMSKKSIDDKQEGSLPASLARRVNINLPWMISSHGCGELNKHELQLLQYSAEGNLEGLKEMFEQQTYYLFHLDVNCVDSLDRTALSLATLNHHLEIIQFLLSDEIHGLKLGDALFYAIQCEFVEAIELLLEKDPQTSLQVAPGTTSPFEPGLTPFMLAAHRNNYRILSMLYNYSHRLTFSDNELLLDEGFDPFSWDAVMERLLHYRARASPAFMLLMFNEKGMSWDPLNAAMDLFGELHVLATREREVDESYLHMAEQCEMFATDLLQEVRSANELADLMCYDLEDDEGSLAVVNADDANSLEPLQRQKTKHYLKPIEKAVKYEMKDFVTSDNAQLALIYIQKGSLFRGLKGYKATLLQAFLGCIFPFLSIAFLLAPKSAFGRLMLNPTVKFWCWLLSEIVFVLLLLSNTILMQYDVFNGLDEISPFLIAAYFWIVGKFIQEVKEIKNQGLREYMSDIWNWNDMATILLYTAFMILRIIHFARKDDDYVRRGSGYWHAEMWDPLPLSDICIAVSYILIHMRIMELLRAERTFGPLQVSLDLMLHDALRFSIIFCIVFLAFGSGITELYIPYGKDKNCSCNATNLCDTDIPMVNSLPEAYWSWDPIINGTNSTKPPCVSCKKSDERAYELTSFFSSLVGLFWTLFGYGTPQLWYKIENCPQPHQVTETIGGIIIGLYHFGAIIVIVNMLIAMMSNSFQKTHDDSEREWKFHRTQLWLKFIRNEINRPPPMNIIPQWKVIKAFFQSIGHFFRRLGTVCMKKRSNESMQNHNGSHLPMQNRRHQLHDDINGSLFDGETRYAKVVRLVVLRYVKLKVLRSEMVI
ncbi:short transient receptor potential channel 5-like isoform X3 [Clavelina lepadiformis]|uniref:short transient receptor potential channel 5-like isoform X3 n=1 Tax=Clavelina lepadiformis TaxID=159417 RepID=UPI0040420971